MSKRKYTLDREIELIKDENIREWTKRAFALVPEEFWKIPSSLSGKYHPADEIAEGGKVLHTKRAFVALLQLINSDAQLTGTEKSRMLAAILLHDTGYSEKIGVLHPIMPRVMCANAWGVRSADYKIGKEIFNLIEAHMGKWSQRPCPAPSSRMEIMVHQADYIVCLKGTQFVTIENLDDDEFEALKP